MGAPPRGGEPSRLGLGDLAILNRQLCLGRLRAAGAVAALVVGLGWLGVDLPLTPIALVVVGLLAVSGIGLASPALVAASRLFFRLQSVFDLVAITLGIAFAAPGREGLLLRPIYALVIVPASLVSRRSALVAATGASLGHAMLLVAESGVSLPTVASVAFLGPILLFFLIARECASHGDQLRHKNTALTALTARVEEKQREVAEKGRLSTALLELAGSLSATLEAPELLARMSRTARQQLRATWSAIFLVNASRATFRVAASARGAAGPPTRLEGLELPLRTWLPVERFTAGPVVVLEGSDAARLTDLVAEGYRTSTVLVGALLRETTLDGLLVLGFAELAEPERGRTIHLLAGMAQHASLVLRDARTLEEARRANALRSEFVATVSHELRTPLNVILGYLQMLLDEDIGSLTDEQSDAVRRARSQSLALLEMIPTLLELHRLEAGHLRLERRAVVIGDLLRDLAEHVPEDWARPGVELRVAIVPELPVVETDAGKLTIVLRSLLHNAFKFTEAGRVTLAARPGRGGDVAISVTDTGRGIPADALEHVFDMFHQVPGAGGEGVGLGLHIVQRYVELLGGTISVESTLGRGSCFTVTLPRGAEPAARAGRPTGGAPAKAA